MNYLKYIQHFIIAALYFLPIQGMNIKSFPLEEQKNKETCCINIRPLNSCLTMPYLLITGFLEYPKHTSKKSEQMSEIIYGDPECAICFIEYSLNQKLYQTPCNHIFDRVCLDQ